MAKNLKSGQTVTNEYGDVWDSAILVCDHDHIDYKDQTYRFRVDVYKNSASRTAGYSSYNSIWYNVDKTTFLANFDMTEQITTLKTQTEDYALTLLNSGGSLIYGNKFE